MQTIRHNDGSVSMVLVDDQDRTHFDEFIRRNKDKVEECEKAVKEKVSKTKQFGCGLMELHCGMAAFTYGYSDPKDNGWMAIFCLPPNNDMKKYAGCDADMFVKKAWDNYIAETLSRPEKPFN